MFFRCGRIVRSFPEIVVHSVLVQFVPEKHLLFEARLLHFVERPEIQVKLVAVRRLVVERDGRLPSRLGQRLAEEREKAKRMGQVQGAVVAKVVADEPLAKPAPGAKRI